MSKILLLPIHAHNLEFEQITLTGKLRHLTEFSVVIAGSSSMLITVATGSHKASMTKEDKF